ncbi:hypothetical protein M2322_003137 [Rhodoblastus acidophilus]|nr:hypothetical protein [Rhodoblastus acidophilus]
MRFLNRFRRIHKETRHFARRFQMPLGVALKASARLRERDAFAHTRQNILQRAVFGTGIEHIVMRENLDAASSRHIPQDMQSAPIRATARHVDSKPKSRAFFARLHKKGFKVRLRALRGKDQQKVARVREQIIKIQKALAFFRPAFSGCEQAAQLPPSRAIPRIGDDVGRAVGEDQTRAHHEFELSRPR